MPVKKHHQVCGFLPANKRRVVKLVMALAKLRKGGKLPTVIRLPTSASGRGRV